MFELRKFRAQMIQIIGFSFMTPVGKLFLSIPDIELDDLEMVYFSYWMISLFLLYLGIICLARSQEIMEGK